MRLPFAWSPIYAGAVARAGRTVRSFAIYVRQSYIARAIPTTQYPKCSKPGLATVVSWNLKVFRQVCAVKHRSISDTYRSSNRHISEIRELGVTKGDCQIEGGPAADAESNQRRSAKRGTADRENEKKLIQPISIKEEDIEESFVRGSGPGGQKINKTSSCVMLKHLPTGIVVRCQESRSQHRNRELARRILHSKLEVRMLGERSRLAMENNKERARKAVKRRKAVKKHFKSRRDCAALSD